jgi:hypothetical protein
VAFAESCNKGGVVTATKDATMKTTLAARKESAKAYIDLYLNFGPMFEKIIDEKPHASRDQIVSALADAAAAWVHGYEKVITQ